MDKKIELIVAALALIGGVLIASGSVVHLTVIKRVGIPMDKQAVAGGLLFVIALCLHLAMGGRLLPWKK